MSLLMLKRVKEKEEEEEGRFRCATFFTTFFFFFSQFLWRLLLSLSISSVVHIYCPHFPYFSYLEPQFFVFNFLIVWISILRVRWKFTEMSSGNFKWVLWDIAAIFRLSNEKNSIIYQNVYFWRIFHSLLDDFIFFFEKFETFLQCSVPAFCSQEK